MNTKTNIFIVLALVSTQIIAQNKLIVNADIYQDTISRHIYGHFSEHLGHCIYGGFYVGDNSKIPNTRGIRNDVVDALKKLKTPNLRWPGGCFADTYHWKDGIGPKAKRPKMVNTWWGGLIEDNSFGTHEFFDLCHQLGAEPYISGNAGSGTVQEMGQWIEYMTFDGMSPMAELRKKNGREKPWKLKYFSVGNETWGCGGNMKPDYYANLYRQFSTYLNNYGSNKLYKIASGANSDDYNWTETLMRDIYPSQIDATTLHHYSIIDWNHKGSATNFSDDEYFKTMKSALYMNEIIKRHSTIMDKYDPNKKKALIVDEWGGWYDVEPGTNPGFLYQQNTMRDALIAGVTLNIFNQHADRVKMANLAQTVNVLQAIVLTDEKKMIVTPTYHVMEMYNIHQDAVLLHSSLQTSLYSNGNDNIPTVSASASKDKAGFVHISLTNADIKSAQTIDIDVRGINFVKVNAKILAGKSVRDFNSFEQPENVIPKAFTGFEVKGTKVTLSLPAASVLVLELQ